MKNMIRTALAITLVSLGLANSPSAQAQTSILADVYGQGVHCYFAGNNEEAYQLLSTAINNGIDDPRAYYFRGIVAEKTGRSYEAESDWRQGAELEARGKVPGNIGRALARYQGHGRLKLEQIRQKAKLDFLALSNARAKQRYGEIEAAEGRVLQAAPAPPAAMTPPAAPPAAENPFADDNLGAPKVESDDALSDAMTDPFANDPATTAPADATGDAPAADPFGGAPAADDPFGGDAGGAMDDPFGPPPADDPFGGDPFGN